MPTIPNYRNATGAQSAPMMTNMAGTYQFGVVIRLTTYHLTVFRRNLATGAITTYDLAVNTNAVNDGITPVYPIEDSNSPHYAIAVAVDDQDRIHIAGNSLTTSPATPPHYMRSDPNDTTHWTSIPWPYPNFPATQPYCTYNCFNRMSDGRLLYSLSQRDSNVVSGGTKFIVMIQALGADTYTPLVGTGIFATTNNAPPVGEADRVYLNNIVVEPRPSGDRVHVWGHWRTDSLDSHTQCKPWYIYSDNVTNSSSWKRIDGSAQTMPISWTNSGAATNSGATISSAPGTYQPYNSWNLVIDKLGYPHVIMGEDSTTNHWHCWWNGTAWTSQNVLTGSAAPSIFMNKDGGLLMYRNFAPSGQIRISSIPVVAGPTGVTVDHGNPVDGNFLIPYPDQILLRRGILSLLIPDGDTPVVRDFGYSFKGS